ncbi:receptor-like protein kinase FERONIA [Nymphaea colorata]|nr:receptor-like protein kinase FERONIA [Nymphaea colorata]
MAMPRIFLVLILYSVALRFKGLVAQKDAYVPVDSILLNCGSSGDETDSDGRKWKGDVGGKIDLTSQSDVPVKAQYQDPSLPSTVPYMSARIFSSESTYTFQVTPGPHWIRLHFYPASYSSLAASDSFFSVTTGGFTLLHNFSAAITAQALTQSYIIKEYSVNCTTNSLNITFSPSADHPSAYAFVNGIEIISMPDIYYSDDVRLVGFEDQLIDISGNSFQMMYRLNVGGQFISAAEDSGLSRTWYDDTPYLYGAGIGITTAASKKLSIQYSTDTTIYTAPVDVYSTARSMGPDPKINQNYNLTWNFQVDKNFTYIVRLHFCELQYNEVNQRVFDIYLNNQTAQESADIIGWASSKAVPVHKDYAVMASDADTLWVALHPSVGMKPEYLDAVLNGIEIFKINDATGNLAGPNPIPSPLLPDPVADDSDSSPSGNSGKKLHVIGGAAGSAAVLGALAFCVAVYYRKKREGLGPDGMTSGASAWLPLYGGNSHTMGSKVSTISGRSCTSSHVSSMAANLCRHFTFQEIKQGTKNFNESLVLGVGGFGKVYVGEIDGGTQKVAIKRANPSSEQGVHEFQTEIEMLSKLRHRHLVSLIGYCEDDNEMILVYDYMAQGTLREHLYKSNKPPLSWKQRLEICIGAARGLHYLHTGAKYTIIHRDVKTTNILLDDKFVAKVSDFGLSKTGPGLDHTHVSTVVKGSFGYLDPEYFRRQQLTDKSDVYSFGVVLFEVLCARPALNPSLPKEQVSLADWALHCMKKGVLEDIIDPQLKGKINPECLKKFAETAQKCLSDHGMDRPAMGDVLWNLEFALQLQESSEDGKASTTDKSGAPGLFNELNNHSSDGVVGVEAMMNEDASTLTSTEVFSQLISPKGR